MRARVWTAIVGEEGVKLSPDAEGRQQARLLCPSCEVGQLHATLTEDGKVLVRCQPQHNSSGGGECSAESVVAAMGLEMRDLFPPGDEPASSTGRARSYRGPLFGNVPRAMWEREDLSRDVKVLFAFLCSCPGGEGLSGIIRIPFDDARELLKLSRAKAAQLLTELEAAGLVVVDGRWAWIVDRLAMTPGFSIKNPKHLRAITTALADAPRGIAEAFRLRYLAEPEESGSYEHSHEQPNAHSDAQPNHGYGGRKTETEDGGRALAPGAAAPGGSVHGVSTVQAPGNGKVIDIEGHVVKPYGSKTPEEQAAHEETLRQQLAKPEFGGRAGGRS